MTKYRFIQDLTSDVLFEAYGKTKQELFANAASALFSVICKINKIKPAKVKIIKVKGANLKELLFNWLQELIVLVDTEQLFFSRFAIEKINDKSLRAKIYGEPITPEKGETVVKAVTYYRFNVTETAKGYKSTVSLDI